MNERLGNFSSSKIWMLASNGKAKDSIGAPFYTYVKEKQREKRLGRPLENDHYSKPTTWGSFVEQFAFNELPLSYKLESKKRYFHDSISNFCGAPDTIIDNIVGDIKCPYTLNSFCNAVDSMKENKNVAEALKQVKKEWYWQLISNSILTKRDTCELTLFVPYEDQIEEIKEAAYQLDGPDQRKFEWIFYADKETLPYLIKGKYYNNIYTFGFKAPKEDKEFLISRVEQAEKLLNDDK